MARDFAVIQNKTASIGISRHTRQKPAVDATTQIVPLPV
jgi:hypothetical protein